MTTSLNRATPAREIGYQMAQYICARITANPATTGTTAQPFKIGTIPAGSVITNVYSKGITALAGGTTPAVTVGTNSPAFNNVAALAGTNTSEDIMPTAGFVMPLAADTDFWANISGGATGGDSVIAIQFLKPLS